MILKYEVKYLNEFNILPPCILEDSGLISGSDEGECIENLKEYYGKEKLLSFKCTYIQDDDCDYILPSDMLDKVMDENEFLPYFNKS